MMGEMMGEKCDTEKRKRRDEMMTLQWNRIERHTVAHDALAPSFYLALLDQIQWQEPTSLRRRFRC